jgi:sugar lactone lactonase YvrE
MLRMSTTTKLVLDGLCFPEGPRWRDGYLYFSDMHAHRVMRVDPDGRAETVVEVPDDEPSGLGFLPDGRLLIVSMRQRRLLRLDPGGLVEAADLSSLASFNCNDMVVDDQGRAYVGNLGSDVNAGQPAKPAELILVPPGGEPRVAATGLLVPNGCVITQDRRTLIVAESFGARLTAFDIRADGSLSKGRTWAQLAGGAVPDGICLDAEGAIWVAFPLASEVVRVLEGGQIVQRIPVRGLAAACMLGGADRRTLFICAADTHPPDAGEPTRDGRIECVEVEVPGAGLP